MVEERKSRVSFWRAALGGVLGNVLKAAILLIVLSIAGGQLRAGVLLFALLGIPPAAIAGVLIAVALYLLGQHVELGKFGRALIGAGLLLAVGIATYITGISQWSADNYSTWVAASLFYGDFGLTVGTLAGLMAAAPYRRTNA